MDCAAGSIAEPQRTALLIAVFLRIAKAKAQKAEPLRGKVAWDSLRGSWRVWYTTGAATSPRRQIPVSPVCEGRVHHIPEVTIQQSFALDWSELRGNDGQRQCDPQAGSQFELSAPSATHPTVGPVVAFATLPLCLQGSFCASTQIQAFHRWISRC